MVACSKRNLLCAASVAVLSVMAGRALAATTDYPSGSTNGPLVLDPGSNTLQVLTGSATQAGNITETGAASINKTGAGTLIISGQGFYTGGTTLSAGVLAVRNNAALGSGAVTAVGTGSVLDYGPGQSIGNAVILGGTSTQINVADAATQSGVISETGGARSLEKTGSGFLALTGNNTYTGATTVSGGVLSIGSAGTSGSIAGNLVNNAAVIFNRSDTLTYSGVISGAGGIFKQGAGGNLILTGDSTGSGVLTISTGQLSIGAGGTSGAYAGNIIDNTALVFNRSDASSYGGVISGSGTLTKQGAGVLTLSGMNTYSGATTVNAGALAVNGSIASPVMVASGGTLQGTGTVRNTVVQSGGTLAAGSAVGSLTVNGSLNLQAGSAFAVTLDPAGAGRVNVTGAATLAGGAATTFSGAFVAKRYTILGAGGGVSGAFSGLTSTNLPTGFLQTLSYDANAAYVNLALAYASQAGLNRNSRAVADGIGNAFNANGGIDQAYAALTPADLAAADGQAAGANVQLAQEVSDQLVDALFNQARRPSTGSGWSVRVSGLDRSSRVAGRSAIGSRQDRTGIQLGSVAAQRSLNQDATLSLAASTGRADFKVAGPGGGRGKADITSIGAGLRHGGGAVYLTGGLVYSRQKSTINRSLSTGSLHSQVTAETWSAELEAGWQMKHASTNLVPYVSLRETVSRLPAYSETATAGSGALALSYAKDSFTASRFEAGVWLDREFSLDADSSLTLLGQGAIVQAAPQAQTIAGVTALPGSAFTTTAAAPGKTGGLASVGLRWNRGGGLSISAIATGQWAARASSYGGRVALLYSW